MKIRFLYESGEWRLQDEIGYSIPYQKEYPESYRKTWMAGVIFKDWHNLTKSGRKKFKEKYASSQTWFDTSEFPIYKEDSLTMEHIEKAKVALSKADCPMTYISFADMATAPSIGECSAQLPREPKKRKKKMFDPYDDDCGCSETVVKQETFSPEKRYYLNRVDSITQEKCREIHKTYNLEPVEVPNTLNDLIQRIKDGKYTIKNNAGDKVSCYSGGFILVYDGNFSWGTVAPDETGAQKARDAIEVAATKARDAIVAGDAAAGLAAIQAFQTQTF